MMNANVSMADYEAYMSSYDESKDAVEEIVETNTVNQRKHARANRYARKKKAFYKARNRMEKLHAVAGYDVSPEDEDVVRGMLRSHQFSLATRDDLNFGCSRANKRRIDADDAKMNDFEMESEEIFEIA